MEPTTVARATLILVDQADGLGVSSEEMLEALGLPERSKVDPDARVPLSRVEDVWRRIIARNPDPALGLHLGSTVELKRWGLVGYTLAYSQTLGCALDRIGRYSRIINESLKGELTVGETEAVLTLGGGRRFDSLRHPVVGRMAALVGALREITGDDLVPQSVGFCFERPDETAEYAAYFRCALEFDLPVARLVFRRGDLDRPVRTGDDTLVGYLDRLAGEALEMLGAGHSFEKKVRRAMWADLTEGQPTVKRIAAILHTSVRTLQRRLREEGTTFAGVLEGFRREMAAVLLRNRDMAIYEVAYLLGYSEPSTFYRAFRRWHDCSPREFRLAHA